MSDLTLTKIRFRAGVWEGRISGAGSKGARPDVQVWYLDQQVADAELSEGEEAGIWSLRVPVPAEAIADGVQTFVISDGGGTKLGHFSIIAGEALGEDLHAEVELLRAELDMLKRAFRRHCLETM